VKVRKLLPLLGAAIPPALVFLCMAALPADAASPDLNQVIDSIRTWVTGLLAALATLFLTIAGFRYLTAGGNPRALEQAKDAIKSALIGYALAGMAPILVQILRQVLHI